MVSFTHPALEKPVEVRNDRLFLPEMLVNNMFINLLSSRVVSCIDSGTGYVHNNDRITTNINFQAPLVMGRLIEL